MKKWLIISIIINLFLLIGGVVQRIVLQSRFDKNRRDTQTEYYLIKTNLFDMTDASNQTPIIFLGDSQIEYCDWAALFQQKNILNRGIAGDVTAGLLGRIEEVCRHQPTKIFIQIGVNDLAMGFTEEEILEHLKKMVKFIRTESPETELFLNSVLPVRDWLMGEVSQNVEIKELNKAYRQFAIQNELQFIDLQSVMADEDGNLKEAFTSDGLHLTAEGYEAWKQVLLPLLMD